MQGILFTPENIDLIVHREKMQTRRLGGLKEINKEPDRWQPSFTFDGIAMIREEDGGYWFYDESTDETRLVKPRYRVGEVVYIKEAWATEKCWNVLRPSELPYRSKIYYVNDGVGEWPLNLPVGKWRSPIFMPEWAARNFLKILDMRAERLLDITPEDCIAEGIRHTKYWSDREYCLSINKSPSGDLATYIRRTYFAEWDEINPEFPSSLNPWCFRYCYELTDREGEPIK